MKIHGIPRIFRITTHRWEFHPSASTAPLHPCPIIRGWSVAWCAWTVTTRHFESNFQPAESYPTPGQGKGWGCSPGKGGHSAGSAKKRQKERERERRNKRQKRGGKARDESRQRSRLNFLHTYVPSFFSSLLAPAREIQFSCPRAIQTTACHAPPSSTRLSRRKRAFVLRAFVCHRPTHLCIERARRLRVACSTTTTTSSLRVGRLTASN